MVVIVIKLRLNAVNRAVHSGGGGGGGGGGKVWQLPPPGKLIFFSNIVFD